MFTRSRPIIAALAALALLVAACGDDDDTTAGSTTTTEAPSSTSSSSTTDTTTATTGTTAPDPGEPTDFGPGAGGTVAVSGVAFDDVLNVREGPGVANSIVATLDPTATTTATGDNRILSDNSIWYGVQVDGVTGFASSRFLNGLGETSDITADVIAELGSTPTAETMLELGQIVADTQASTDVTSDIVVVVAPSVGDLGEVTYDVIGLADDSVQGLRLHVFGQPDGDSFGLKSVEATALCGRSFGTPGSLCA